MSAWSERSERSERSELPSSTFEVEKGWIDEYGHMNAARYVEVFDREGFKLLEQLGVGLGYTEATRCGIYTVDIHVAYYRELLVGSPVVLRVRALQSDDKRLLCLMELSHATEGYVAATMEQLSVHVNLETRRAAPFPGALAEQLALAVKAHAAHPLPAGCRTLLSLKR
ncbi:thioesterase family protein [Cupriavidus metallidurans]|uniref:thioesterase family protein n=1 Tax=Cupriavidus metallidurans TaxID=119219 RepID=UPI003CFCA120